MSIERDDGTAAPSAEDAVAAGIVDAAAVAAAVDAAVAAAAADVIGGLSMSAAAHEFFEMSLDNVCVAGFDGYFKRLSPSWTRTLGWTAEELMAKPSLEFVHPEDRNGVLSGRGRLQAGIEMGPLVNRYLCKDGSYRWFEWRSVADTRGVWSTRRRAT